MKNENYKNVLPEEINTFICPKCKKKIVGSKEQFEMHENVCDNSNTPTVSEK